jgi:hypothetical protein
LSTAAVALPSLLTLISGGDKGGGNLGVDMLQAMTPHDAAAVLVKATPAVAGAAMNGMRPAALAPVLASLVGGLYKLNVQLPLSSKAPGKE